jgi:hypothetical protein
MNWQAILSFVITGVINLTALVSAYYGLKADNATLAAKLDVALVTERAARGLENATLKATVLDLLRGVEQNIKELGLRIATLETGQDEWTKSLRERTHELSEQVNTLVLKVDRLERPKQS